MNSAMISILLPCILLGSAFAAPHTNKILMSTNPWEEFEYAVDLDVAGKYWMFWTPDDNTKTITFEVHVEALGYVGFGISPNGGMTGADVVIGWVKDDGTAVFHDRHALGEYEPIIDESQDVTLLSANQNDTHTILRFSRPYVTCEDNDRDITADTIRVIFSFTDTDPEDITGLDYHGSSNRGTKSVILLNYNEDSQSLPDDAFSLDILISENTIPRKRTTYWCEFLEIPQMEEKHHVVMFEPVIQPGNEGFVHHIAVYACYGEISDDSHGQSWDCIWNVMPDQHKCSTVMFVWAVGGNPFYFPEHAGVPFFTTGGDSPSYVRIEMHYDNPAHIEGITDHSGIRIHMTPTLREYDIGVMTIGADVSEKMIIPPHYNELTMRGHCTSDCFGLGLNTTDDNREDDHMNVFAVYQHSHLLGRKMKTRLYRDGAELQPLMNDEAYDFNFQETRMLKEERQVYLNDLMVVDCGYDSSDKDDLTKGGLATKDEMCVVFVYYYPAHDIISCLTLATQYQTINAVEGIKTEPSRHYPFFRIIAPPEFAGKEPTEVLRQLDWTSESQRNRYQDVLLEENTHMTQVCVSSETGGYALPPWAELSPELGDDWIDPDDGQCSEIKKIKSLTNLIN